MYSLDYFNTTPIILSVSGFFLSSHASASHNRQKPKLFPIIWWSDFIKDTVWNMWNLPFTQLHFIFSHWLNLVCKKKKRRKNTHTNSGNKSWFLTQSTHKFPVYVCTHVNINKMWKPLSALCPVSFTGVSLTPTGLHTEQRLMRWIIFPLIVFEFNMISFISRLHQCMTCPVHL